MQYKQLLQPDDMSTDIDTLCQFASLPVCQLFVCILLAIQQEIKNVHMDLCGWHAHILRCTAKNRAEGITNYHLSSIQASR